MTAPTVSSISETSITGVPTTWTYNLPATVALGDLLILFAGQEVDQDQGAVNTPTGWTKLYDLVESSYCGYIFAKKADGTESGGTVVVTTTNAVGTNSAGQVYRILAAEWGGTLATDVDIVGTDPTVLDAAPDPPSVTAGWGSDTNLFIAATMTENDDATISAYPANYTDGTQTLAGGGQDLGVTIGTATRALESATDDPGAFTISETERWVAATLVIKPGAGASSDSRVVSMPGGIIPVTRMVGY